MPIESHSTGAAGVKAPRVGRFAATLALLWVGFVLLVHLAFGHFACSFDTSGCLQSANKTMVFRGHLPFANTPFQVLFYSVQKAGGGPVGGFRTDSHGDYCVVWAPESGYFVIHGSPNYGSLPYLGQVLHGRPPAGCQYGDQGVPWFRARDLTSSIEYISVIVLGLVTMWVLGTGIAIGRAAWDRRVRVAGLWLALASTVLFVAVWFLGL